MDNPKIKMLQARMDGNIYTRHWQSPLMKTCCNRPGYCFYSLFCSPCASYELRKSALHGDMRRYLCCGGHCPCSGRMNEQSCPEFCLCLEVCLCFSQSVASTRWMIQDEMRVETTPCDNCIIGTMIALQYIACICHLAACITGNDVLSDLANLMDIVAHLVFCTVCACMQTQHKIELEARDKDPSSIYSPGMAPQIQMIPPPQVPYPGYPPQGYPPPPPPGYPPQGPLSGYPPQGYPPPPPQGYQQGYAPQGPPAGYPPQYPPQQGYPPQGYPPQQGYQQGYPPQGPTPQGMYK